MLSEQKPSFISGNRKQRGTVKRDRFNSDNVFLRATIMAGFPVSLHADMVGARGGVRHDILSVWISEPDMKKIEDVFTKAQSHSSLQLVKMVDSGQFSEIYSLLSTPGGKFLRSRGLHFNEFYSYRLLAECYKRAYERDRSVYRTNLGYLTRPERNGLKYDEMYVSLDFAHTHSVTPKKLQNLTLEVIESIISAHPELTP